MSKILIVNNNEAIRESVKLLLASGGHTNIIMASDGAEAFELFQTEKPDLVITDINMSICSGLELIKQLRANTDSALTPVIVLSASTSPHDHIASYQAGADMYINKLIEKADRLVFLAQVTTLLQKNALRNKIIDSYMKDTLTDLPRRESFNSMFKQQVAACKRSNSPLSISILDIDYFKQVNDTCGHVAGDNVLKEFAQIVRDNIRPSDGVFRFGGEEFVVLLPNTSAEESLIVLNRVRDKIKATTFTNELKINFSAGLYEITNGSETQTEEYLGLADKALYEAKNNGRDRIVVYTADTLQKVG